MKTVIFSILLLLCVNIAKGQEVTEIDKFKLYTGCSDVDLLVEGIRPNDVGLTKWQVETTARSRLRGARIYDADAGPWLYVQVNVLGPAHIIIELKKSFYDLEGRVGTASAWRVGAIGTHGRGDSGYILQGVGEFVDSFIDEYLRVNAPACD